jgi:hypothetical protein
MVPHGGSDIMAEQSVADKIADIQSLVAGELDALKTKLHGEFESVKSMPMSDPADDKGPFIMESIKQFRASMTQVKLLTALIDATQHHVPRVLLLIRKGSNVHGWAGRGFSPEFMAEKLKRVRLPIEGYPELMRVIHQGKSLIANFNDLTDLSEQISDFDGFTPLKSCFFPIKVKNKVAAVLYCDSGSEPTLKGHEMVEAFTYLAGLELTLITSKLKTPDTDDEEEASAPQAQPAPAAQPAAPVAKPKPAPAPTFEAPAPTFEAPSAPAPKPAEAAPKEDPKIKKAKRVARVLVSDLKLYNEEQVNQGIKNRDLYNRLQEDLDRSFKHYQERVANLLEASAPNYFKEELVRQLGNGDPAALGPIPF